MKNTIPECYDVKKFLLNEKIIKPEVPELAENHSAHDKRVWYIG